MRVFSKQLCFVLRSFATAAILLFSNVIYANTGFEWLESIQNADGSYSKSNDISTSFQSTIESLRAFNVNGGTADPSISNAFQFVNNEYLLNTKNLSQIIIAKVIYGLDVTELVSTLLLNQNPDGGFGDHPGHDSTVLNTALAAEALAATGQISTNEAKAAATYLVSIQNADGSWSLGFNEPSIYITSLASISLQKYVFNLNTRPAIDAASDFLIRNQRLEGGWDSDWQSASALLAIAPVFSDSSQFLQAIDVLRHNQLPNGSWNEDSYVTALSLRALNAVDNIQVPSEPSSFTTGRIIDADGSFPLDNATISLNNEFIETKSEADGSFKLYNTPSGSHTITYSTEGYLSTTLPLVVQPGDLVNVGNIRLTRDANSALITGIVTDAYTGQSLPYTLIILSHSNPLSESKSIWTDDKGKYSITIDPGDIEITVMNFDYPMLNINTTISVTNETITLSPSLFPYGSPPASQGTTITGEVLDVSTNQPILGATIEITSQSILNSTNSSGYFEVINAISGEINLIVNAIGYKTRQYTIAGIEGGKTNLDKIYLTSNQPSNKTIIRGVVGDIDSGNPISGALVRVEGTALSALTDVNGYYEISDIEMLNFSVFVQADGYLSAVNLVKTTKAGDNTIDITLEGTSAGGITIQEVATDFLSYSSYSPISVAVTIENLGDTAKTIHVIAEILDSTNTLIDSFAINGSIVPSNEGNIPILPSMIKNMESAWYTANQKPGDYKLRIRVFDDFTGQILSERVHQFIINTTINVDAINIVAEPRFTNIDATEQIRLTGFIDNRSNVIYELSLTYVLSDPLGNIVRSDQKDYQIEPGDIRKVVTIDDFAHTFTNSGEYTFDIQAASNNVLPEVITNSIVVAPSTRIEISQDVSSTSISPDSDNRIRLDIRLEGVSVE